MGVSGQLQAWSLYPGVRVPVTRWIGGWVGPRVWTPLYAPAGNLTPVVQPVA